MSLVATPVNQNVSDFRQLGYCVVDPGLPPERMDQVNAHLEAMLSNLKAGQRPEGLIEPHVLADDWRFWLELCREPLVLEQVAKCLGAEELLLLMSHLIVKPPKDGLAVRWHQDNTYWPSVKGTDVVTVWLALDQVDRENGCMNVIPSSHDGYPELPKIPTDGTDLLSVRVDVTPQMEAAAVALELSKGSYSVHDSFIIHGSNANLSARRRAGYTMRYANAATVSVDTSIHNKPVYYVLGDGTHLKTDYLDLRPGCALPEASGASSRNKKHEPLEAHKK